MIIQAMVHLLERKYSLDYSKAVSYLSPEVLLATHTSLANAVFSITMQATLNQNVRLLLACMIIMNYNNNLSSILL